jgi:hypothetical protein
MNGAGKTRRPTLARQLEPRPPWQLQAARKRNTTTSQVAGAAAGCILSPRSRVPITIEGFRRLALSLPDVVEAQHMGHPDFRVGGRIFATLGSPDPDWGMIQLPPELQEALVEAQPKIFRPVKGAWGLRGATNVCLRAASVAALRPAMALARAHVASKAARKKPAPNPRAAQRPK